MESGLVAGTVGLDCDRCQELLEVFLTQWCPLSLRQHSTWVQRLDVGSIPLVRAVAHNDVAKPKA